MRVILISLVMIFSQVADAAHIGQVSIKRIRLWNTYALVETNEAMTTASCAEKDNYFMVKLGESDHSDRRFSVLLSAFAQNKKINPNCATTCDDSLWLGAITVCSETNIIN